MYSLQELVASLEYDELLYVLCLILDFKHAEGRATALDHQLRVELEYQLAYSMSAAA